MKYKSYIINGFVLLVSVSLCLVFSELIFRHILFGTNPRYSRLRKPSLYTSEKNSDYWKLYYRFGGAYKPPAVPHPLLGWIGDFDAKTLLHSQTGEAGDRRPVLLYGDSYARCMPEVSCFESILNADRGFSKNNYLLNYGVNGYGVDQIAILMQHTYSLYQRPFVVFSIFNLDLDRSVLEARIGQKPYFTIDHDSLVLNGVPIDSDPARFYRDHPPHITSYLWRKLLYADPAILPSFVLPYLKKSEIDTAYKIKLNEKILMRAFDELKRNKADYVFVVFHYLDAGIPEYKISNENWRDRFLERFISENKIPCIWSKDIIRKDMEEHNYSIDRYIDKANHHPTTYLNELISREIKKRVLAEETDVEMPP
jgi:hypothetical protein